MWTSHSQAAGLDNKSNPIIHPLHFSLLHFPLPNPIIPQGQLGGVQLTLSHLTLPSPPPLHHHRQTPSSVMEGIERREKEEKRKERKGVRNILFFPSRFYPSPITSQVWGMPTGKRGYGRRWDEIGWVSHCVRTGNIPVQAEHTVL